MKRTHKKLGLHVETIRPLEGGNLTAVVGGTVTTAMTCTESVIACRPSVHVHCHTQHPCAPVTTYMTCTR